jgi:hypothetical protein
MVVAKGPFHVAKLVAAIEDSHAGVPRWPGQSCACSRTSSDRWTKGWLC